MPAMMQEHPGMGWGAGYMSVRDAIREQAEVRKLHAVHQPTSVRMPPTWSQVHAKDPPLALAPRTGSRAGFPRADDALAQASATAMTASYASSVSPGSPPTSPGRNRSPGSVRSALGGSVKSGLNHPSTYSYEQAPMKPGLAMGNPYSGVGSNTMMGSQAVSYRQSSGAFGFGTSTRDQHNNFTYISPAHLKATYGKFAPSPDRYTLQSSLGRQVLDTKTSYPSRSFGLEERFDADRRDLRAATTPGPGAYRV